MYFSGVVWCGVVWCGVVWCGVVWCGVVWCGVVWCCMQSYKVSYVPVANHVMCLPICIPAGMQSHTCAVTLRFLQASSVQRLMKTLLHWETPHYCHLLDSNMIRFVKHKHQMAPLSISQRQITI